MPRPLDPNKREAIAAAIREGGKTAGQIARDHNVARSTVSKIGKELEQELGQPAFERSQTKKASEAREADARLERSRLRELLLADAHKLREQLWRPCVMHNFGGKDNTHNSIKLTQPTFEQQKQIMTSVGIAVDKIIRLDDQDTGAEKAAALLDQLVTGLRSIED